MHTQLIDKIIALAQADDDIRAVILEGSMAAGTYTDDLSDYDVNIYARDYAPYLADDRWMDKIGDVLLYQKEAFDFYDATIPTRLVLFRDQPRVDFSFWHSSLLADIVRGEKRYDSYENGYQILVDKDHLAEQLPPPRGAGFRVTPPGREAFRQTLYDVWFEAQAVAKHLARGDLWYAKLVNNRYIKEHLFRMALWHHQAERDWAPDPRLHLAGKQLETWAGPDLIAALAGCFAGYNVAATWESLLATMALFHTMARQTARHSGIEYPARVEHDMLAFVRELRDRYG